MNNFLYTNEKGQKIVGTAAFIHFVYTVCGGVENYNKIVKETYARPIILFPIQFVAPTNEI